MSDLLPERLTTHNTNLINLADAMEILKKREEIKEKIKEKIKGKENLYPYKKTEYVFDKVCVRFYSLEKTYHNWILKNAQFRITKNVSLIRNLHKFRILIK